MELSVQSCSTHQHLGPTTLHLQHELYLTTALTLLTISSLQAMYGESFGSWGDVKFIFFVSVWFARHLILRWICTSDSTTTRCPSLPGLFVFWWTSHVTAGQYFDRPNPQVVAKHVGSSHTDEAHTMATLSSFFSPSIRQMWHLCRVRVWFPLLSLQEQFWSVSSGRYSVPSLFSTVPSASSSQVRLGINKAYSYWNDFWALHGLQLPHAVLAMYIWYFLSKWRLDALRVAKVGKEEDSMHVNFFGAYSRLEKPSMGHMLILLSIVGTLASILLYGRISLPFPDLVAGNNVLKAVRSEAKSSSTQSTKSNKSKSHRESVDVFWADQYKSITAENRFRLICKIAAVRLLEGIFICVFLPRMGLTCRHTGHCQEGLTFRELAKIMYPVGITSPQRSDFFQRSEASLGLAHFVATMWTVVSVAVTTVSILLAQATTLNRSYLGNMGYIAGGWAVVDRSDPCLMSASLSQWDPRRRYKKGDLIVEQFFRNPTIYKATSNSPEGRPLDVCLRATHALFSDELGHPSTSTVIAFCSTAQLGMMTHTVLLILAYMSLGQRYGSFMWILAANVIGSYGIVRIVRPPYDELQDLAEQIKA